jgi:hypothetical protein
MPVGVIAFWTGMSIAAQRFPAQYDWRYMTISVLIYPERNPAGHIFASAALAACAFAGLLWVIALASVQRIRGLGILAAGYLCMILSSLLPERLLRVPNGHEVLAILGFISMCGGLVVVSAHYFSSQRDKPRVHPALLTAVALSPIAAAALTQAYLSYCRPELPWVGLAWRTLGIPVLLSFALWEWLACAVLSVLMTGMGIALGAQARRNAF